ncbi:MAG: cysteine desulfurase, partial [Planctomycetaceae bacterium]|nr:cysteine desulfurase [Planctomycetaceae bacterium]
NCLGCTPREIVFTSGATEANNLAIKGVMVDAPASAGLIVNAAEHKAVLDPAQELKRRGRAVHVLPVDAAARVQPQQIQANLTDETRLVSVMLANNEVGSLHDVASIAELCHDKGTPLHTDATQAIGRVPVNLNELPVDMLSCSSHKIYGPPGIGLLFVRRSPRTPRLTPLFHGGGHEWGMRSGTLPLPLIVGFAKAMELAVSHQADDAARLSQQRDRLWNELVRKIPGVVRNTPETDVLPNNLNITIPNIDGDVLFARLKASRLCVSSGSACTSANPEPSHVLRAMGLTDQQARASIRFGLGRYTTDEELREAVEIVVRAWGANGRLS